MIVISSTSGRLHSEFVRLLFLQDHRETDNTRGHFHFRRVTFSSQLTSRVGNFLVKDTGLHITINLGGVAITSKSHTYPSYSQTSRLLTSSLSLGVPVPLATQCM
jgi:hypothetical protein